MPQLSAPPGERLATKDRVVIRIVIVVLVFASYGSTAGGNAPEKGENWLALPSPDQATVLAVGVSPAGVLFAGSEAGLAATFSDGVYLLNSEGAWEDVSAGLPTRSIGDLALGPDDGSVHLTTTVGVFRSYLPR